MATLVNPNAAAGYGAAKANPLNTAQANPLSTPSSPGVIGGALPWGGGGAQMFQGLAGDPASAMANLGSNYATAYNSALGMNQQNYENVLKGYQQTAETQRAGQQQAQAGYQGVYNQLAQGTAGVTAGYNVLGNEIQSGLRGAEASQRQDIADAYARSQGSALQGLVSRGLGNTTVANAVSRGLSLDQQKANIALSNQFAQTRAGYQAQLGLADVGYRGAAQAQLANQGNIGAGYLAQNVGENTALAQNQLGFQERVNAGYPNAQMYGQLAQQYGAIGQANADRSLSERLAQQRPPGISNPPVSGGNYVPAGGGFSPPTPNFGGAGSYGGGGGGAGGGYGTQSPFMAGTPGGFSAGNYAGGGADWLSGAMGLDWSGTQLEPDEYGGYAQAEPQDWGGYNVQLPGAFGTGYGG